MLWNRGQSSNAIMLSDSEVSLLSINKIYSSFPKRIQNDIHVKFPFFYGLKIAIVLWIEKRFFCLPDKLT